MDMDLEIIEQVIKGNVETFEELIEKYNKMVFNLAYRICNNLSEAENITQDVFFEIYKNIEKFSGKESIKILVYITAYNICINKVRKSKHKNSDFENKKLGENREENREEIHHNEMSILNKEGIKEIESALNQLDEISKVLIFLRDIQGFSYNEVSEITSMNIGNVKTKLNIARNNLKELLKL